MTRFTDRVTRDLHQIADRSTPSSTAWDSIRTRIDEQTDQPPTMEVIMLSPDRNDHPSEDGCWPLLRSPDSHSSEVSCSPRPAPTTTPCRRTRRRQRFPAEPAPDAEVDPDAEAVVVPAPDPTTAAEVAPEPEPGPEPVTVTVTGTFAESGVSASATPMPSSAGLTGDTTILGTTIYEGQFAGSAPWVSQFWPLSDGSQFGAGEFLFTGTIEGLGSGTLSFIDVWQTVDGVWSDTSTITGGTGDFEGASGTGTSTSDPANPSSSATGSNVWTITVPPKGSLETVTATGTAVMSAQTSEPGERPGENVSTEVLTFEGSMVGTGQINQTTWTSGTTTVGSNTMEFTGTIDGLGTGTMTMLEVLTVGSNGYTSSVTATGGTGDFEGITGTGTWNIADGTISYTFVLTAPVNQ